MKKKFSILLAGLLLLAGCGTAAGTAADPQSASSAVQAAESALPEAVKEEVSAGLENIKETLEDKAASALSELVSGITVLAPNGAPAMSTMPMVQAGSSSITFVDGADALQAALVNPTPEYDIIIAPSNLGMKLAAAGKTTYRMLGVVTWGNLYMVGNADAADDPSAWTKVAAFGEQSVTGTIFNKVLGDKIPADAITWYNSTAEASAALLAGEAEIAMLAEPNATATIGKAKENGKELKVISDLQELYGSDGFPQAALFVREDRYNENKAVFDGILSALTAASKELNTLSESDLLAKIEEAGGAEQFGIPSSAIASKTWQKMNIKVEAAKDHMDELAEFAKLFGIEDISGAVAQ